MEQYLTFDDVGKKCYRNKNGEIVTIDISNIDNYKNEKILSHFRGQASRQFMEEYYGDAKKRTAEGDDFFVECSNGHVIDLINEYTGSLQSSMTYAGACNLIEFKNNVNFFTSTSNYLLESDVRKF
jgi:IMP dehydrogenase